GMSRYRWPMHYALLNNDCLWVMDETQLMGVAVTTTAQLQGLREKLKTIRPTHSVWMSATLDPSELSPIDHPQPKSGWPKLELGEADQKSQTVQQRLNAIKPLHQAETTFSKGTQKSYAKSLADEVLKAHQPETLTLVVVNRVDHAQNIFQELEKFIAKKDRQPQTGLIHSRFRWADRRQQQDVLLAKSHTSEGTIVIATQAIEAGVDVSATTMFIELALWPSLVQRFGRCNRKGDCGIDDTPPAQAFWVDIDTQDKSAATFALPYRLEDLDTARKLLFNLADVGPAQLKSVQYDPPQEIRHTIRKKDVLELWDTTPDLAGNDLDVSRYIRDSDDTDFQVYWRNWEGNDSPPENFPKPVREELCSVPLSQNSFFRKNVNREDGWVWDALDRQWKSLKETGVRPGMTILLRDSVGGYKEKLGWTGDPKQKTKPVDIEDNTPDANEAMEEDDARVKPVELAEHLQDVAEEVAMIRKRLPDLDAVLPWEDLTTAAWWHDVGKAHEAFQTAARDGANGVPPDMLLAKMAQNGRPNYRVHKDEADVRRVGFRHELASALAYLAQHGEEPSANLIAFLIASHHGKVRGSIRSLPNEMIPDDPEIRFARGIWEGDELPAVPLGNGQTSQPLALRLALMQLGETEESNGHPSWTARILALREKYGPFQLAFLETLLRVADWRGSAKRETSND
ncbi:MAG: CRISPR-associated endonuclease Cas3'', partial [Planctomycetaceae bacterium]|nr:CRISPR-associated endonuclease Cas3'' [Planctomycetaceae bacterium]